MTERELAEILRRNPDIRIAGEQQRQASPPLPMGNNLEAAFFNAWRFLGGPPLEREYRFHPTRRWRFDFAHPASKVAVELNGGVWTQGRHTRGRGYLKDREKINAATALGWRVFELGTGQVTLGDVQQIVEAINNA